MHPITPQPIGVTIYPGISADVVRNFAPTGGADPPLLWRRQCPQNGEFIQVLAEASQRGGQSDAVHVRKVNMGGYATGNALAGGSSVVSI